MSHSYHEIFVLKLKLLVFLDQLEVDEAESEKDECDDHESYLIIQDPSLLGLKAQ